MANTTIADLTTISAANIANDDLFIVRDVSANTDLAITTSELRGVVEKVTTPASFSPTAAAPGAVGFSDTNTFAVVKPSGTGTYTTTVPGVGMVCYLMVVTTGTTSYTLTLGTGFRSTGTLATGTTSARIFMLTFISDGTSLIETSRTTAIA